MTARGTQIGFILAGLGLILACGGATPDETSPPAVSVPPDAPAAGKDPARWAGRYAAEHTEELASYTLSLEGPVQQRLDGTLEATGVQLFYVLRVRAYEVDGRLQVVSLGVEDGAAPWSFGVLPEPDVNTPLFSLVETADGEIRTEMGVFPGESGLRFSRVP